MTWACPSMRAQAGHTGGISPWSPPSVGRCSTRPCVTAGPRACTRSAGRSGGRRSAVRKGRVSRVSNTSEETRRQNADAPRVRRRIRNARHGVGSEGEGLRCLCLPVMTGRMRSGPLGGRLPGGSHFRAIVSQRRGLQPVGQPGHPGREVRTDQESGQQILEMVPHLSWGSWSNIRYRAGDVKRIPLPATTLYGCFWFRPDLSFLQYRQNARDRNLDHL